MIDFVYRQIHQSRIRKATNIQVNQKMKTNKIWSILGMLVVSVMLFTSCSSDDDGDGSKDINVQEVVGTWTCTASTDKVDGNL